MSNSRKTSLKENQPDDETELKETPPGGDAKPEVEIGLLANNERDLFAPDYEPIQAPRTNKLQNAGRVAYKFAVDGVPFALIIKDALPQIPAPFDQMVTAAVALAVIEASDVARALTGKEYPLSGLSKGVVTKHAIAAAVGTGAGLGMGFLAENFGPELVLNYPQAASWLVNPLINTGMITLTAYALYGMTKLLLECLPYMRNRERYGNEIPKTTGLQNIMGSLLAPLEPLALYEALRLMLIYTAKDPILRNEFYPLIAPIMAEVLKGLNHFLRIPRPFANVLPQNEWPDVDTGLEEEGADQQLLTQPKQPPAGSAIFKRMNWYTLRASLAVATLGLASLEFMDYLHGEKDEEKLSAIQRRLSLYTVIVTTTSIGEPIVDGGYKFAVWSGKGIAQGAVRASECFSSLWQRCRGQKAQESTLEAEEDANLERRLSAT